MQKKLLKYSYIFLLYPFLILTIVVNINTDKTFAPERVIFFYLLFYFLAFFIKSKKVTSLYVRFVYILSLIISFIEIGYVEIYKERITASTAFIILETNIPEVKEYLNEYFKVKIIILFFILVIPSIFILRGTNKLVRQTSFKLALYDMYYDIRVFFKNKFFIFLNDKISSFYSSSWKKITLGLFILILATFLYFKENHHNYHAIFQLYNGYESYSKEVESYEMFLKGNLNQELLSSINNKNSSKEKETYVLIIGESTTRNHLGIYDYYRNTTPLLNKLNNELIVFKNVISPHSHTIASLEKVLTFGNSENPEARFDGTIIQLMKQAGFKTYWISNQVPIGINETLVAMIAKTADYVHFTNLGGEKELHTLDEKVLPYFQNTLNDTVQKKFIVIHLLGTHTQYKNRYPDDFNQFDDVPKNNFNTEEANSTINEYDNSVLYNDFIISGIIEKLKENSSKNEKMFALYLSDHGEDVFETVDFTGHSEVIGSKPMFEIPFIYWTNEEENINKFKGYVDRKYMIDDLIYSVADLSNVTFFGMDLGKSIFNDTLHERKRIIRQNLNFDEHFK